jgi:ribosome-associated protein
MAAAARSSTAKEPPQRVSVDLPITLGQFVKLAGWAGSGGDAKQLVAAGEVRVNGEVEPRRGHKLTPGDAVESQGRLATVVARFAGRAPRTTPSQGRAGGATTDKEKPQSRPPQKQR